MTRIVGLAAAFLVMILLTTSVAGAQAPPSEPKDVDISYELGGFDDGIHDFTISAVKVAGGLTDGEDFTVELRGSGDRVIWSATQPFTAPETTIHVDSKVGVGDVDSAGISQKTAEVLGAQVVPSEIAPSAPSTAGSGQLALSMVLTLLIVVIVFRTPLPSASTQRWTR